MCMMNKSCRINSDAWDYAQKALSLNQKSPHPCTLLGALCYELNRHDEGDTYFQMAFERGASDQAIKFAKYEAKNRAKAVSLKN